MARAALRPMSFTTRSCSQDESGWILMLQNARDKSGATERPASKPHLDNVKQILVLNQVKRLQSS